MSLAALLIGLLNCILLVAILVLLGAVVAWVASAFAWPIPWNIQRLYLLVCLIVFIICVAGLLVGSPMVHFFRAGVGGPALAAVPPWTSRHLSPMLN